LLLILVAVDLSWVSLDTVLKQVALHLPASWLILAKMSWSSDAMIDSLCYRVFGFQFKLSKCDSESDVELVASGE
jgi:hypothetical protein